MNLNDEYENIETIPHELAEIEAYYDLLSFMGENGANINAGHHLVRTPLYLALIYSKSWGYVEFEGACLLPELIEKLREES